MRFVDYEILSQYEILSSIKIMLYIFAKYSLSVAKYSLFFTTQDNIGLPIIDNPEDKISCDEVVIIITTPVSELTWIKTTQVMMLTGQLFPNIWPQQQRRIEQSVIFIY